FRAHAYEDGDFQIWHTENQDVKLNKGFKLGLEEEFRFGDSASELYYQHYDFGLAYDVNKYLTVSGNYRQIWELEKGEFEPEYRPHLNASLKYELWGFKLEDRNRLEYRAFDSKSGSMRYRNKFTVKYPFKIKDFELEPYVADEIFANLDTVAFKRNRLYAGLGVKLIKNVKADVYYLLQSSKKSGHWTNINALGLKLKISF
ncbi:MAG: DUF2490 domain-containing protein, partial [Candidatus Omnitrophica bacterium]|nr:DUF2490 domain-containing protein [Candidatus Omnitrophota bacterium]